ncbi:lipoprotein, NlpB [Halomonas sp. Bachu 37]|uniref:lipoprotein, NlpB n=1 Tax=Halomonas kashgarensis TaxID=3084920 RepID=UPI003217F719
MPGYVAGDDLFNEGGLMNSALKWMPLTLVAAMSLAGCARDGFYHDRNLDYVEAAPGEPLVLPPSRNESRYTDAMPVPRATRTAPRRDEPFEVRAPQTLATGSAMQPDYVERRSAGDRQWLVVAEEPGRIWPQLEHFARTRQLGVQSSNATQGVIETNQGRLSLTSGLREGSSEIRCERGGNTLANCLEALESHLSARSAVASTSSSSLSAQRLNREQAVELTREGDRWQVDVPLDIDRVWAELSHYLALDFTQEEERELLAEYPEEYAFLVEYKTLTERNRNPIEIVFSPDVRQMSQQIRLELEPAGQNRTILRAVNDSERAFSADDQRELLERVSGYLR